MEKNSTYTLNRNIVWAKAEYTLELALEFQKMVVEGFALYFFNRHAIYHSYYMSAKGYSIKLGSSIDILVYFSIISIIMLFLVPARKGSFWDAD
jgi:hypothetical protein